MIKVPQPFTFPGLSYTPEYTTTKQLFFIVNHFRKIIIKKKEAVFGTFVSVCVLHIIKAFFVPVGHCSGGATLVCGLSAIDTLVEHLIVKTDHTYTRD